MKQDAPLPKNQMWEILSFEVEQSIVGGLGLSLEQDGEKLKFVLRDINIPLQRTNNKNPEELFSVQLSGGLESEVR